MKMMKMFKMRSNKLDGSNRPTCNADMPQMPKDPIKEIDNGSTQETSMYGLL